MDLAARFKQAVVDSRQLTQRPDNATLLRLYALYKQGTEGDNAHEKPGLGDLVGRAKWDAWDRLKGTPGEDAMRQYIDLVDSLE